VIVVVEDLEAIASGFVVFGGYYPADTLHLLRAFSIRHSDRQYNKTIILEQSQKLRQLITLQLLPTSRDGRFVIKRGAPQYSLFAFLINRAPNILASEVIFNPVPIADIQALLRAIAPNRVLNKAGEVSRKTWVEPPRVLRSCDRADDAGATVVCVTGWPKTVFGAMATQDT
jgi:hypothetical protein